MGRLFFISLLVHSCVLLSLCDKSKGADIPAVLVFGDSTVDTGNNNFIPTWLKADHAPNGLDFIPASGRFSNGRLMPDLVASALGIKESVPPFLDPKLSDEDVRTGVCFASAGSGFDSLTTAFSGAVPVSEQLQMFYKYLERLKRIVGEKTASNITSNALIIISAGTNDLIINVYGLLQRRIQFSNTSGYHDFLFGQLQALIQKIYSLGGRKFVVFGLGLIGCVPARRNLNFLDRSCRELENSDAEHYNYKLEKFLRKLQHSLLGSRIAFADVYGPVVEMTDFPQKFGLEEITKGCCGTGLMEGGLTCNAESITCKDRSKLMFWDVVHPTEFVYEAVAKRVLNDVIPTLY